VVSDGVVLLLVDFALGCIDGDGAEDDHLLGAGAVAGLFARCVELLYYLIMADERTTFDKPHIIFSDL